MSKEIELPDSTILDMDKDEVYIEDFSGSQITIDTETAIEIAKHILKYYQDPEDFHNEILNDIDPLGQELR